MAQNRTAAAEFVGPIDTRQSNPAARASALRQAYNDLPAKTVQPPAQTRVSATAKQAVSTKAAPLPTAKPAPPTATAAARKSDYLVVQDPARLVPLGWAAANLRHHSSILADLAPTVDGGFVDDRNPDRRKVYLPNSAQGGALYGRASFDSVDKMPPPPGASPEFIKAASDSFREQRLMAGWVLGQEVLNLAADAATAGRAWSTRRQIEVPTGVLDNLDSRKPKIWGQPTDSPAAPKAPFRFTSPVSPEVARAFDGQAVPGLSGGSYAYSPQTQRLGVVSDTGLRFEFRDIDGKTWLIRGTDEQVAKLQAAIRAERTAQNAADPSVDGVSQPANPRQPGQGSQSDKAPETDVAGGGDEPPRLPPGNRVAPGAEDPDQPGNGTQRPGGDLGSARIERTDKGLLINRPQGQSLRVDFDPKDRDTVDRLVQQATGRTLQSFAAAGARGQADQGDLFSAVLKGLDTAAANLPATNAPIVIRDRFHGREGTITIDKGQISINVDTGVTDTRAVEGLPRLDSAILRDSVLKSPALRDRTVNLYTAIGTSPSVGGVPLPIGQASLQAFLTFPLGQKVTADDGSSSPAAWLEPRDLRNPLAYIQALNDVRLSRDALDARPDKYLVPPDTANLVKQQTIRTLGLRGVVNLFLQLDAALPFAKNEQRVYFAPLAAANEGGIKVSRDGKISLNVDRMDDGTYRLKKGAQLTLDFREANNAQPGYLMQALIGGAGFALGGPEGAAATLAAAQIASSSMKRTDGLAGLSSTGYRKVLTSDDVLPAFLVDALTDAAKKSNAFKDFAVTDAAIGQIVHKHAPDRAVVFARLQPESLTRLGPVGYTIPAVRSDGTVAAKGEAGAIKTLVDFFRLRDQQLTPIEQADLLARINAVAGADGKARVQGLPLTPDNQDSRALERPGAGDPDGLVRLEPADRNPDSIARLYRMLPGVSLLYLDVQGGGVAALDRQQRLDLLGQPTSANGAMLERPEFVRNPKGQAAAFQADLRALGQRLDPAFIGPQLPPPGPRLGTADLQAAGLMQRALATIAPDSSLFERNHIDPIAPARPGRNTPDRTELQSVEALYRGEAVTADSRTEVERYLTRVENALPAEARPDFQAVSRSVVAGLVDGQTAEPRALDTLDTIRLSIEAANPQSSDRNVARMALTERVRLTQLNDDRRAQWEAQLSPAFRGRVPDWEARMTEATGGILPAVSGDHAHAIKRQLQQSDPHNLNIYHLRIPAADLIPKGPMDRLDRPYYDFDVSPDDLYSLLDDRVRPASREKVIAEAGLDRAMYVGPPNEDYKFNFVSPVIENRYGNGQDPYALKPTPGIDSVGDPQPFEWQGRRWDIVHVDGATGELHLARTPAQDLFVTHADLTAATGGGDRPRVAYRGDQYHVAKVETQSGSHGLTLKKLGSDGKIDEDAKPVFVPQFSLPEVSLQQNGVAYRAVGSSWTTVQFQADNPVERVKPEIGTRFQAFVDDAASGVRASGGAVDLRVIEGNRVEVTASANPTVAVGRQFALDQIMPTVLPKASQHLTGEHLADENYVVSAGSPVAVRTADILTHLNRASPLAGGLGALGGAKVEYLGGQRAFDSAAQFISGYRDKVAPRQLTLQNVVYEFLLQTDSGKTARPILDALKDFRKRYPDTPIVVYSSNSLIATKLGNKKGTLDRTMAELQKLNIEFRSREPTDRAQTTHAKGISILGGEGGRHAGYFTTAGFEPRDRPKTDVTVQFGGNDARLYALYNMVSTLGNAPEAGATRQVREQIGREALKLYPELAEGGGPNLLSREGLLGVQDRLARDLAARGVMVQDPTVGRGFVHAGYRALIGSTNPQDRTIVAQIRELRMPSLTQMLIDEARNNGKQVLIQASMFDRKSYEMLQQAARELPNLRFERIGSKSDPSNYAHYNMIATESAALFATGYAWDSMQNPFSEQPSSEAGVLISRSSPAYRQLLDPIARYQQQVGSSGFTDAYNSLIRAQPRSGLVEGELP